VVINGKQKENGNTNSMTDLSVLISSTVFRCL